MDHLDFIQKIEELSMSALPALETQEHDGWLLRFSDGYAKRANSINPLYYSRANIDEKIDRIKTIYQNKNLNVIYKLTPSVFPADLDTILEKKEYVKDGLTSVRLLNIRDLAIHVKDDAIIYNCFHHEWFMHYCELNNVNKRDQSILEIILKKIKSNVCYVLLLNEKNEALSCGMGVIEEEYIGVFDIVTNKRWRNKGYAKEVIFTIINWGKKNSANKAYLQVVATNIPAINLYSKIGFKEIYKYWYRIKS